MSPGLRKPVSAARMMVRIPMEPATHTLTGYMMSRAGLSRWCPRATPVLLMAANVPDIDFVSAVAGPLAILDWHRGPTHAVLWVVAVALLPLLPMLIFARRGMIWKRAYVVSVLGVLSHILIDWTNIYGVRLFSPAAEKYFHLDITGVVDFWLLAVLALCAGWFLISRLVSSEIGAARASGRGVAIFALLCAIGWQGTRYFCHERALAVLDSRTYEGEAARRVAALPHFSSPLHWTGLVETEAAYRIFEISLLNDRFDPSGGKTYYKPEPSAAMEAARRTHTFQRFFRFSEYPLWQVTPVDEPEGGLAVQVMDVRFGLPGEERFVATAILDSSLRVIEERFQFDPPGGGPRFR